MVNRPLHLIDGPAEVLATLLGEQLVILERLERTLERLVILEGLQTEAIQVLAAHLAGVDDTPAWTEPEECRAHTCSYYTHYLVYGGPDLTHEGFHAAEKNAAHHIQNCDRDWSRGPCSICIDWEKRIRA
jgi:hypothetical protein